MTNKILGIIECSYQHEKMDVDEIYAEHREQMKEKLFDSKIYTPDQHNE